MTREQIDTILKDLGLTDRPAVGRISHAGGTRVVDVWESEEAFDRFLQEQLGPAFERAGVQLAESTRPQCIPAWHVLK